MMNASTISTQKKLLGLFSVVRVYNLIMLVIAQYLASIFIFSVEKTLSDVICNKHLLFIVLATISVVSSGYIINDFYDATTDAIDKPVKTKIGNWVSQQTKLNIYFTLNFLAFLLGVMVSWRAALFFSVYIFAIWFYSHKLKKYPIFKIITISILDILPFFAAFVYYKNISYFILFHGLFLYIFLLIKEIVKDFERDKGAVLTNRATLVLQLGVKKVNAILVFLLILLLLPMYFLVHFPEVGMMQFYFYTVLGLIPVMIWLVLKADLNKDYFWLHNLIKLILTVGVFSIALIDTAVLLERVLNKVGF